MQQNQWSTNSLVLSATTSYILHHVRTISLLRTAASAASGGCASSRLSLDRQGRPYDGDKSVWHQGRFAWLLGTVARTVEAREEWVGACEHGVRFLREHCTDPSDGRLWFHLDADSACGLARSMAAAR